MELEVLNIKGEKTGRSINLAEEVFGIRPNDHVIWLDVKRYNNAQRQGTHKAKERSELKGSTKKLHKQKGTGGSRKGDIKNPLFRGGARIFGPRVRSYDVKMNQKEKLLARRSALSHKVLANAIIIIENIEMAQPKTKEYITILKSLNIADKKSLLVMANKSDSVIRSARNIPNTGVMTPSDINTYAVVNANTLVLTEDAVNILNENLK